jgi:hypothetical protein
MGGQDDVRRVEGRRGRSALTRFGVWSRWLVSVIGPARGNVEVQVTIGWCNTNNSEKRCILMDGEANGLWRRQGAKYHYYQSSQPLVANVPTGSWTQSPGWSKFFLLFRQSITQIDRHSGLEIVGPIIVTRSDLGDMLLNSRIHGDGPHARLTRTIAANVRRAKGRTEEWL